MPYVYQIGEYDVTTAQYTAFLNAVASGGDPYNLYTTGMATVMLPTGITQNNISGKWVYAVEGNGNMPVFERSWGDAARFVNWLGKRPAHRAVRAGARRDPGTYTLNGAPQQRGIHGRHAGTRSTATGSCPR